MKNDLSLEQHRTQMSLLQCYLQIIHCVPKKVDHELMMISLSKP